MNKKAVNERIASRDLNLSAWCKRRGLVYPIAYQLLNRPSSKIMETRGQIAVVDALIADGLYVPDVDEAAQP
jgi:hypothetical protein